MGTLLRVLVRSLPLIVLLMIMASFAIGQAPRANFSTRAEQVLVNATVVNAKSQFVFDLRRSDFLLRVDRKETPIAAFSLEDEPVSAAIVIDASRSMKPAVKTAQEALRSFLTLTRPEDEYGLVVCQDNANVTIPLTQDVGRFMQLIPFITPRGATPLFDSVERAAHLVQRGHNSRKVVVVISDGEDTSSRVTLLELERLLTEADVHLYVIQLWAGSVSDDRFALRKSAEETGGSFFSDIAPKRLPEVISRLDVHWQYVIAFEPPENTHVRSHSIQVRMAGEAKVKNFQIFYRHAYTEPLSGSVN